MELHPLNLLNYVILLHFQMLQSILAPVRNFHLYLFWESYLVWMIAAKLLFWIENRMWVTLIIYKIIRAAFEPHPDDRRHKYQIWRRFNINSQVKRITFDNQHYLLHQSGQQKQKRNKWGNGFASDKYVDQKTFGFVFKFAFFVELNAYYFVWPRQMGFSIIVTEIKWHMTDW